MSMTSFTTQIREKTVAFTDAKKKGGNISFQLLIHPLSWRKSWHGTFARCSSLPTNQTVFERLFLLLFLHVSLSLSSSSQKVSLTSSTQKERIHPCMHITMDTLAAGAIWLNFSHMNISEQKYSLSFNFHQSTT